MMMKNKLYKHHKKKAVFVLRQFSLAFIGMFALGLAIGIPTYISSIQESQISTKAQDEEKDSETTLNELDNVKKTALEEYKY